MRLLIVLGIIYLVYRAVKSWLRHHISSHQTTYGSPAGEIDDIMVKDPYCEVYFLKRNGVPLRFEGNDLYFCSTECRDKFVASHSKKST